MINVRPRQLSLVIIALSFLWLSPLLYRPWNRSRLFDVCGFVIMLSYGIFRFIASGRYRPLKKNWTPQEASDRIKALTQMLAFESHDRAELLHQRAMLQISQQEWEAAVEDFTEALKSVPETPGGAPWQIEAYHYRGTALVRLERFKEAMQDLTLAMVFNATYKAVYPGRRAPVEPAESMAERADCYLAEGDYERAESDLRSAIPLLEGEYRVNSLMLLATILERKQSQWQEALEQYNLVLQQVSTSANIFSADNLMVTASTQVARGRILSAMHRFDEAVAAFDDVISAMSAAEDLDEDLKNARLMRAEALLHCGEPSKAALDVELVLAASPGDLHARVLRALVAAENQQFKLAVDELQEVLKREPDNLHALRNYAVLLTGAHDDSLRDGNRALDIAEKLGPQLGIDHWFVLSIQAAAHAELGDFQKAVELAARSLEAAPEEQKARRTRRLDQFRQRRPFRCEPLAANHQQAKLSQ
jgi:tetratricopeptide (TPR) repeat protein